MIISKVIQPNDPDWAGKKVLLIGSDNEKLGQVSIEDAFERAYEEGLDLVAVADQANPPVCRIMDQGKFLYEKKKKLKEQRKKNQSHTKTKEIKFHVNTEKHDYDVKLNHIIAFLKKGYKVKVSLFFRGREMQHTELGLELVQKVLEDLEEYAVVDSAPNKSGRMISAMVSPLSASK